MSVVQPSPRVDAIPLREQICALYDQYAISLDDLDLDVWTNYFTESCFYRIVTRENWMRGLPLSTVKCEGRGMLADRAAALQNSMMFAPRVYRRFCSVLKTEESSGVIKSRTNFFVAQTLVDRPTEMAFCGVSFDKIVEDNGALKFAERICVLDTEMIPNSLIYPL